MPGTAHLIGGGREPEGVAASHAPFLAAVDGPVLCVILDEPADVERWTGNLAGADVRPLVISPSRRPAATDLDGIAGVYVAGGLTPAYQELLCGGEFAAALRDRPFAGFSAGAAIASEAAIVGGWRLPDGLQICDEDAGEDLGALTVRPGLGLVGFAVDVHATQWGTLTRAVHAVASGAVPEALAIDEHTCVEVRPGGGLRVHGHGCAYRVAPGTLDVLRPG